jgi:hypothetical protein
MPHTHTPPSAADTLLVTTVAGRIERALADRWHLPPASLHQSIDALCSRGFSRRVVSALHYLRMERNRVLHHPRQALRDPARFHVLAVEALSALEGTPCTMPAPPQPRGEPSLNPQPLASAAGARTSAAVPTVSPLVQGLRALVDQRMQALLQRSAAQGHAAVAAQQLAAQAMARLRGMQARYTPSDRL